MTGFITQAHFEKVIKALEDRIKALENSTCTYTVIPPVKMDFTNTVPDCYPNITWTFQEQK